MTYKEDLQNELKTFKEVYITHLGDLELKEKLADIIAWYEEQIALEERIEGYARKYFVGNQANTKSTIFYP